MEENDVLLALTALSQMHRLRIFRMLVVAGHDGLMPAQLTEQFNVAPATLSFHLKELTRAGLITQERIGRNLIYRAEFQTMDTLLAYLSENCCQGSTCLVTPSHACECA